MQEFAPATNSEHEWRVCRLMFPRVGMLVDRHGLHKRLIMPGAYYARRSRSMGRWIYRRRTA